MTLQLRLFVGTAALLASLSAAVQAAPAPARVESLTLKEVISRLDQVDFDLQGLEAHINEFRKDVQANLGNAAAIRVLDIGVGLVRSRVQLNQAPQLIGAMQRESRTDSWQRSRQDEMMKRQRALLAKHGNLYRVVEGYAADVKQRFGIDLEKFFQAVETAMQRGDANVESIVGAMRQAVSTGDKGSAEQITRALSTGESLPPPSSGSTSMAPGAMGSSAVVSATPHPTRPGFFIVRYADGREEIMAGRDNGDGTVTLSLPGGQSVTTSIAGGAVSGAGGYAPGQPGAAMDPGATSRPGGGMGQLAPNVERLANGGFKVITTGPSGEKIERYFPPDFQGIGTKYLGEQGSRLTEETRETLDPGTGEIRKGENIRWQFSINPTGQAPEPTGGVRASFKLVDRNGQGGFTVTGWKISQPDGGILATGTGEDASAVATQSGSHRVEFSGKTAWGSPFRIEVQLSIAVN